MEKRKLIFLGIVFGILISLNFAYSAPQIEFVNPTPDDGTTTLNTSMEINVSITEANLNEMKFNWDGVNYSFYDDSLVLMMNFDNVSALGENDNLSVDVSKYGNNGTVSGGAVWNSTGKYRGAYEFDGVNDYIEVQDNVSLNFSNGSFSFSVWINPLTNDGELVGVLDKGAGDWTSVANPTYGWYFGSMYSSVNYVFQISDGDSGTYGDRLVIGDFDNLGWVHIVVTVDNANDNPSYIRGYINGENKAIIERTSKSFDSIDTSYNLYIGKSRQFSREFNGTIDEVKIWNRSLSADEIKQIYYFDFYKYDTDKWNFYRNNSNLSFGRNQYSAIASNSSGNENSTEVRTFTSFFQTISFYDNRTTAVVWTGDDWGSSSIDVVNATYYAQSKKVVLSPAIVMNSMSVSSGWSFLQNEIDEGFISPVSHSVSHPHVPYDNSTFEICDSQSYIIGNLTLPWQNQFNGSEFMVGWVEPYGGSDDNIRGNLSECNYLSDRSVSRNLNAWISWVSWNNTEGIYNRAGASIMGEDSNLTELNTAFDTVYSSGGIYHLISHPGQYTWDEDDYIPQHLTYIGNRTDVWYVGWGQLYMYHYLEDRANMTKNLTLYNNRKILFKMNISSVDRNKYGLSYPVTYAFSVPHQWNNTFVFYKNTSTDNYTLMEEKTRNEYWIGIDAYRNNLIEHAVYVSKGFPQTSNDLYLKIVPILFTNFNGSTTDLENTELSNLTNLVLEKQNYGKINFSEEINLSAGGDLNTYINISNSFVSINSTALSELNKAATITLYNVGLSNPRIMKDGVICPSTVCTEVSYSGANYTFTVTGFSNYSLEETPSSTTGDTISGGSSGTKKVTIPDEDLEKGSELKVNKGDYIEFEFKGGIKKLKIEEVSEDKVHFVIDDKNYYVSENSIEEIDLDGDGIKDLKISVNDIVNGIADIKIENVKAENSEDNENIFSEKKNLIYWIVGVLLFGIFGYLVLKFFKRK